MRSSGAANRQCGASSLEISVVIVVISILAATMLQQLLRVQEYAEKVAMELMIFNLRSALRVKIGELLIADRAAEISTLAGANPIDWLERTPENYRGATAGVPDADIKGQWYFDAMRRELVYTANSRRHFTSSSNSDYTVRLEVRPVAAAGVGVSKGQPGWVQLAVISNYTWF